MLINYSLSGIENAINTTSSDELFQFYNIKMGSRFSILNDTEYDIWVINKTDWDLIIGMTTGVLGLFSIGAGFLEFNEARQQDRRGRANQRSIVSASHQGVSRTATVLKASDVMLTSLRKMREEDDQKYKRAVKEFKKNAERIPPGSKYTWSGAVSQTMHVYVMNEIFQRDDRDCVTGPTVDSEKRYTISRHFQNLDVY